MKVEASREETFKPVQVTITLQAQSEVDALYALLNYHPNTVVLAKFGFDSGIARQAVGKFISQDHSKIHTAFCELAR